MVPRSYLINGKNLKTVNAKMATKLTEPKNRPKGV